MTAPRPPAQIRIGDRDVGPGHPTFVIAELSANHGQDLDRAKEVIRMAAEAGADAVKLQTYTAETMTIDSDLPWFQVGRGTLWEGRRLFELYQEAYTPWDWHPALFDEAARCGLEIFSTPFDPTALAFLEDLDPPAYKVASFELVDVPLIRLIAATGRPMILSTGMATVSEIDLAVATARSAGAKEIVLLRCNSGYPADPSEMDLATIPHMADLWGVPIGLSDHTLGVASSVAAVALGACVIEKHVTLSRDDEGPDSAFSLEPDELRQLVAAVREVEAAVGHVRYGPTETERRSLPFRRSIFVVENIRAGDAFTLDNLRIIRPSDGLPPKDMEHVLGHRCARDVKAGTPLTWDLVGSS